MGRPRPVHERVAAQIEKAGLSSVEISKRTGWSAQRVYRLLTGRTDLTADDMETLAKLVEKPVEVLYQDERSP